MKKATAADRSLVINMLTKCFNGNLSVNYIIKQDQHRVERIRSLIEYSIDVCSRFGEVVLSDDNKSCALILYPHLKRNTVKSILLDLKLILYAIGITGIVKTMKRETLVKNLQHKQPMLYIWFIGVDTLHQHQGIGSSLLAEIILKAESKNLPIYLETSTLENLPWYRRMGFEVYDQLKLSYILFFLKLDNK